VYAITGPAIPTAATAHGEMRCRQVGHRGQSRSKRAAHPIRSCLPYVEDINELERLFLNACGIEVVSDGRLDVAPVEMQGGPTSCTAPGP
jgi:hypothetical protein